MVAIVKTGYSIRRILNYNENKISEGVATCIGAANYPIDHEDLRYHQKLARLENQAALNANIERNSLHVTLNFDPSESDRFDPKKNMDSAEVLNQIAASYMEQIGFGQQPYLVYQHYDSGHPHLHIVSQIVEPDGHGIDTFNIGRNQSSAARKEIENAFGLVKAEESGRKKVYELKPIRAEKVKARKSETRRAIGNVLDHVLMQYKYTSLPELNAILNQYNVTADRGSEDSNTFKHNGLLYSVLEENGKKDCKPIKASSFYNEPTLKFLQKRFAKGEVARMPDRSKLKTAIDRVLMNKGISSLEEFKKALAKVGVHTVIRENKDARVYGITFVDHNTKSVFNGRDVGPGYGVAAIQQKLAENSTVQQAAVKQTGITRSTDSGQPDSGKTSGPKPNAPLDPATPPTEHGSAASGKNLLETMLQDEGGTDQMAPELRSTKKKKRKRYRH